MRNTLCGIVLLSALMAGASAFGQAKAPAGSQAPNNSQTQSQSQTSSPNAQNQNRQTIRQMLTKNLQQDGYTDIQMIPSSFLIRAKDHQGHQVSMVVTPDSVMSVTELNNGQQTGGTVGSGSPSGSGSTNSSSGSK